MINLFMLKEAIHSTALSCGCGTCTACRAAAGDKQAWSRMVDLLAADRATPPDAKESSA
jgi:hypothetical protein